ncbi:hypothetical protein G7Y79_00083g100920 [Physcia stellaris]|nr:hypothetical protein G7Y79_00083g100920 [Physcia stellaris]
MAPTLKALLSALVLATTATAAPAPEAAPEPAALDKRVITGAQIWNSGACDSQPVYSGSYSSGTCHNFPNGGGKYGAKFQDNSGCKYKVWENQNCNGRATVHSQNGGNCIPIANTADGVFYLTYGGASVSIVC